MGTQASERPAGVSPRAALLIGFLAGGWLATLCVVALLALGSGSLGIQQAAAEDPIIPPIGPLPGIGGGDDAPSLTDPGGQRPVTGTPNPGGGTGDSNNRAIALAASIGGGQSVVYYFDTERERLLVYQYSGRLSSTDRPLRERDDGGLRLLAARHIDFDLRLEGYRDLSQRTRNQLKDAFETAMGKSGKKGKKSGIPDKQIKIGGG